MNWDGNTLDLSPVQASLKVHTNSNSIRITEGSSEGPACPKFNTTILDWGVHDLLSTC